MRRQSVWLLGVAAVALVLSLMLGYGLSDPLTVNAPALAQVEPTAENASPTDISGIYTDPQNRFEIGILNGYQVSTAGGSPLFQAPDGSLAYAVVLVPLDANAPDPLPDVALLRAAETALGQGEGFQTANFQPVEGGGLQIEWTGRLSQGSGPPQPISGRILAKQEGMTIYLLTVAGTETGSAQVEPATASLVPTLIVP